MKTFLTAAVMALALAASAQAQGNNTFRIPYDDNKNLPPTLDFVGTRVSTTTTVGNANPDTEKLWFTGEGILYGVEVATGAVTDYVVCIDTGAKLSNLDQEPKATLLMANCFLQTTNSQMCGSGTTGSGHGLQFARHFTRGLYCVNRYGGNNGNVYVPLFRKARE